jgi:DNA polymerase-3 subunit gamma/tau
MSYQVLARKWRPQNFSQVVGQNHVQTALTNALEQQRLHHAYLFTGTRGVGKTTIARILAKCLNCEKGIRSKPCGTCNSCCEVAEGRFIDLIEVDAASRTKVEDTRDLLDKVQYAPTQGRFKVYLIDEVHMLSKHSFNALLKTLEEPPPHVKFLLATTDPQKLPATILSRCLQFNLKRMSIDTIQQHLDFLLQQEVIASTPKALRQIARAADGSMRDALSLLDQAIVFGAGSVQESSVDEMLGGVAHEPLIALLDAVVAGSGEALLKAINGLSNSTPDYEIAADSLIHLLHQISMIQLIAPIDQEEDDLKLLAQSLSPEDVQLYYQIALYGRRDLPLSPDLRMGFEMIVLRMLAFRPVDMQQVADISNKKKTIISPKKIVIQNVNKIENSTAPIDSDMSRAVPVYNQWHGLLAKLKIQGMSAELARNCYLITQTDDEIHLCVSIAGEHLHNNKTETELQQALNQYLAKPIKLTMRLDSDNDHAVPSAENSETPAQKIRRETQEKQAEAEQAIYTDTFVKKLQQHFDAKIIVNSIKPRMAS